MTAAARPRVAVVLASAGRAPLLIDVLTSLRQQSRPADEVVIAVPNEASLPAPEHLSDCAVVVGTRGLAAQRNAGVRAAQSPDFVFFFDDDALVHPEFILRAVRHFEADPSVVGLTGNVLLDGAPIDEIERSRADRALASAEVDLVSAARTPINGLYGCNFAVRVLPDGPEFDERLPLYSWLEDRDFAGRLRKLGVLVEVQDCMIVHRGAKSGGRTAHRRLGFTQVMNPSYFLTKRSFTLRETLWEIARPVAKNLRESLHGPHRAWRRQRLRGNLAAASLVLRGRFEPERMLDFD